MDSPSGLAESPKAHITPTSLQQLMILMKRYFSKRTSTFEVAGLCLCDARCKGGTKQLLNVLIEKALHVCPQVWGNEEKQKQKQKKRDGKKPAKFHGSLLDHCRMHVLRPDLHCCELLSSPTASVTATSPSETYSGKLQ